MPRYGNNIDLQQNQLLNARIQNLTGDPGSATVGQVYFNTTTNTLRVYTGSAWVDLTTGAGATDATTGAKGVIQLAGDLAGTAASPQIAAGAIVDADVNAGAAIALSKLATDPLARANHTGTQLAATIGDFNTQVRTNRLDQLVAPTVALSMGNQRVQSVADPTSAQDAATKNYVDNLSAGLDAKASVRVASTANVTIPPGGTTLTIDAIALANGDRVLLKDQTAPAQNGIYVVGGIGSSVTLTRSTDADAWTELPGAYTWVEVGTANADTGWICTVDQGGTLGTTTVTWSQFSASTTIAAGTGLAKTGNTIAIENSGVLLVTHGGTGASTAAGARTALGAVGKYAVDITGNGATTQFTVTHSLGTLDIQVQTWDPTDQQLVFPDFTRVDANNVRIDFSIAPANAKVYRVVAIG